MSDDYAGRLVITWPAAGHVLAGWPIRIDDADTGQQIVTALDLTVHANSREVVTAEMTMLTDADGRYLKAGEPVVVDEDGEHVRSAAFRWLVAEMRVAPQPEGR